MSALLFKAAVGKRRAPIEGALWLSFSHHDTPYLCVNSDVTIPETPESKRPVGPGGPGAMHYVSMDASSDSDVEITGSSMITPVRSGKRVPQSGELIVLSDEEEEEEVEWVKTESVMERHFTAGQGTCTRRKEERGPRRENADSRKSRKRKSLTTDDLEREGPEPSWREQEDMVRRLHQKFPHLQKEELRDVLLEHDWLFEDTLETLRMFSDRGVEFGENVDRIGPLPVLTQQSSEACPSAYQQSRLHTSLPPGLLKSPEETKVSRKKRRRRKKKKPVVIHQSITSSEDEASDFETPPGSPLDAGSDCEEATGSVKIQIIDFFQRASVDELTLMSGCSLKKAQKIVSLRPFKTWPDLGEALRGGKGLSADLLSGCRAVLREREALRGLMVKCEHVSREMTRQMRQVVERGRVSVDQPRVLNSALRLKPYQMIGLSWLSLLHENKLGGILADEMGLGKTIQAISFLASLYQQGNTGPHLIIVPSSTLENWVRELRAWCPSLRVLQYCGSAEERQCLRREILDKAADYNVIVSTYNLAVGNGSDRGLFRKLRLEYAVFDEGHMLKNMNSLRYRHLMAINAKNRLLLTGTPLQNNLLELMSLLNFIMPSMFFNSTSQIAKMFSMKPSEEQSTFETDRIAHAKLIMKPFILRRVKSEVLTQLPDKVEQVEFCAMSQKQEQLYNNLLSRFKGSAGGEKRELINVMMHLRKMANHPLLHRQYYSSERLAAMSRRLLQESSHHNADPAAIQDDMEVLSDFELHQLCAQYPVLQEYQLSTDLLLDSGKLHLLTQLLPALKEKGDRVVLFSQFTMMLDILEVFLTHREHRYIRLDGSTPVRDRIVLIDQFNSERDLFVFLLSTKAGGLGINLTSANVVILHDIDCNPYNDKQAEDRCHRVGQTKTVKVIRLISKDTIEDRILHIGQRKLRLEQDMTATQEGDEETILDDMASQLKTSLGL
ncbi:SWI/SNF-related matrix-associated actin-dependent regulator of chromatin subfamily A containing DEAD/H box 1b [Chanos chanos]|uniref:DNA helicase n=1 Tax=Chanos chanos TaxID=29144 RepID=A0A6J2UTY3_CHACN|nr:SWI/SNF-related matrix-associated actin-dependent regulator of chromatin subfamily A containing DEAD/H box 1B-like [Chanos chanos]